MNKVKIYQVSGYSLYIIFTDNTDHFQFMVESRNKVNTQHPVVYDNNQCGWDNYIANYPMNMIEKKMVKITKLNQKYHLY